MDKLIKNCGKHEKYYKQITKKAKKNDKKGLTYRGYLKYNRYTRYFAKK